MRHHRSATVIPIVGAALCFLSTLVLITIGITGTALRPAGAADDTSYCAVTSVSESRPGLAVTTSVAKKFQTPEGVELPDAGVIPAGSGCAREEVNGAVLVEIVGLAHNSGARVTQAIYALNEIKGK